MNNLPPWAAAKFLQEKRSSRGTAVVTLATALLNAVDSRAVQVSYKSTAGSVSNRRVESGGRVSSTGRRRTTALSTIRPTDFVVLRRCSSSDSRKCGQYAGAVRFYAGCVAITHLGFGISWFQFH